MNSKMQLPRPPVVKPIFLGKEGKIFGPYNPTEVDAMKQEGVIDSFDWVWNEGQERWIEVASAAGRKIIFGSQPVQKAPLATSAVIHNGRSFVAGKLDEVTESGARFIAEDAAVIPSFVQGLRVNLDLMDEARGVSSEVAVKVRAVGRNAAGKTNYDLSWEQAPALLG